MLAKTEEITAQRGWKSKNPENMNNKQSEMLKTSPVNCVMTLWAEEKYTEIMKLAARPNHCFGRFLDLKVGRLTADSVFIPVGWKSIGAFRLVCEVSVKSFECSYSWVFSHLKEFLNFTACLFDWEQNVTFGNWDKCSFIRDKENKTLVRLSRSRHFSLSSHSQPGGCWWDSERTDVLLQS